MIASLWLLLSIVLGILGIYLIVYGAYGLSCHNYVMGADDNKVDKNERNTEQKLYNTQANTPNLRLNTYDNVCGTEQELLSWFERNVYKGRKIIGELQPQDQLRKIAESKERMGTIVFFFQEPNGSCRLETIFVGINKEV